MDETPAARRACAATTRFRKSSTPQCCCAGVKEERATRARADDLSLLAGPIRADANTGAGADLAQITNAQDERLKSMPRSSSPRWHGRHSAHRCAGGAQPEVKRDFEYLCACGRPCARRPRSSAPMLVYRGIADQARDPRSHSKESRNRRPAGTAKAFIAPADAPTRQAVFPIGTPKPVFAKAGVEASSTRCSPIRSR